MIHNGSIFALSAEFYQMSREILAPLRRLTPPIESHFTHRFLIYSNQSYCITVNMTEELNVSAKNFSVDEVQTNVDKLVLTMFEAARSSNNTSTLDVMSQTISEQYSLTLNSINNLIAIDTPMLVQSESIVKTIEETNQCRMRCLELQVRLSQLQLSVDQKLREVSSRKIKLY